MRVTAEVRKRAEELHLGLRGDETNGYGISVPGPGFAEVVLDAATWEQAIGFIKTVTPEERKALSGSWGKAGTIVRRVLKRAGVPVVPLPSSIRAKAKRLGLIILPGTIGYALAAERTNPAAISVFGPTDRFFPGGPRSATRVRVIDFIERVTAADVAALLAAPDRSRDPEKKTREVLTEEILARAGKTAKKPPKAEIAPKPPERAAANDEEPRRSSPRVIGTPETVVPTTVGFSTFIERLEGNLGDRMGELGLTMFGNKDVGYTVGTVMNDVFYQLFPDEEACAPWAIRTVLSDRVTRWGAPLDPYAKSFIATVTAEEIGALQVLVPEHASASEIINKVLDRAGLAVTPKLPTRMPPGTYLCEWCGRRFIPTRSDARYCPGGACKQAAYRERIRNEGDG